MAIMAVAAVLQSGWTWTLYEGRGPVVLANEVPDTPQLKATLECQPGTGVAHVDLYGARPLSGFATLTSGSASATAQTSASPDRTTVVVRTDHPVFGQFILTGSLDVAVSSQHQAVEIEAGHLAKLRRFAELCAP
ncbi:hypothetical protein MMB232_02765 [Brevundimonas subvibrioides]|uniref:hypothetical protein n=1 Tax=Brevundimonas subvibrioides TaxID=74313 RepID=UPI0032D5A176